MASVSCVQCKRTGRMQTHGAANPAGKSGRVFQTLLLFYLQYVSFCSRIECVIDTGLQVLYLQSDTSYKASWKAGKWSLQAFVRLFARALRGNGGGWPIETRTPLLRQPSGSPEGFPVSATGVRFAS